MIGKCALCGKETEMTFEHIPPQSCFNSSPTKPVSGDLILRSAALAERAPWDTSGLPYRNMQSGVGEWSLCADCNSKTGTWYGKSYAEFVRAVNQILLTHDLNNANALVLTAKDFSPLRVVKQMLSMICSINNNYDGDHRLREIADFVTSKHAFGDQTSKFRIFAYIAISGTIKHIPISYEIKYSDERSSLNLNTLTEIYAYPVGFLVCLSPNQFFHKGVDITSFCNYDYAQRQSMKLVLPILETNIGLVNNYLSKAELLAHLK